MFYLKGLLETLKPKQAETLLLDALTNKPSSDSESIDLLFQPNSKSTFLYYRKFDNDDLFLADGYRWQFDRR